MNLHLLKIDPNVHRPLTDEEFSEKRKLEEWLETLTLKAEVLARLRGWEHIYSGFVLHTANYGNIIVGERLWIKDEREKHYYGVGRHRNTWSKCHLGDILILWSRGNKGHLFRVDRVPADGWHEPCLGLIPDFIVPIRKGDKYSIFREKYA